MQAAWIVGLWTLFGLVVAGQEYFGAMPGEKHDDLGRILTWRFSIVSTWMVLTPIILWLGRRFRPERPHRVRHVLVHLAAGSLVSLVAIGAYTAWSHALEMFPRFPLVGVDRYLHFVSMYFSVDLITYFGVLAIGLAVDYQQRSREAALQAAELREQLSGAQLQTLRLQLQPHFLFNTLNTIVGLIRNREHHEAIEMTTGLSDLLRRVLEQSERPEVPLREEMGMLERYLDIQRMRFSDRLQVEISIDTDTLDARVPSFILQPIVENGLRHGIAATDAGGTLRVNATRRNGVVRIAVFNDGPALPPGWSVDSGAGVGLSNTRARLQRLYGDGGRLELRNVDDRGVEATLTIPFRPAAGDTG